MAGQTDLDCGGAITLRAPLALGKKSASSNEILYDLFQNLRLWLKTSILRGLDPQSLVLPKILDLDNFADYFMLDIIPEYEVQ